MPKRRRSAIRQTLPPIALILIASMWAGSLTWRVIYATDHVQVILSDGCIIAWSGPSPDDSRRGFVVSRPLEWRNAAGRVPMLLPDVRQAWPFRTNALHIPLTLPLYALLALHLSRSTWRRISRLSIAGICLRLFVLILLGYPLIVSAEHQSHSAAALLMAMIAAPISLAYGFQLVEKIRTMPRSYPAGHCQRCGYDLTGNESGICSECGAVVS